MSENRIPDFRSYEEMAEFWDEHSLADYWEETEPAELEENETERPISEVDRMERRGRSLPR